MQAIRPIPFNFPSSLVLRYVLGLGLLTLGCSDGGGCLLPSYPTSVGGEQRSTELVQVSLRGCTTVIVPANAIVSTTKDSDNLTVVMVKKFDFAGHISNDIDFCDVEQSLGCVFKSVGDKFYLATVNEWETIEGGAQLELHLMIPAGIDVLTDDRLSGMKSVVSPLGS